MKASFAAKLDLYLSKFESIRSQEGWHIQDSKLILSDSPDISERQALGHWKAKAI